MAPTKPVKHFASCTRYHQHPAIHKKGSKTMDNGLSIDAQELYLFALNDGDLYRQQREHIEALLQKRFDKGDYDSAKAVKLWTYFAINAAKKYHKEFCGNGKWHKLFGVPIRLEVATLCEKEHREEMEVRAD
tara:strand:+ start:614 stop:1009 length:396 start_codon:yes stop_codon:yes gene_type:complete